VYPLSVAVIVGTKELWEDMQPCMAEVRVLFEQAEIGEPRTLVEKLNRMAPDIVLLDLATVREPLEQVIPAIRAVSGQPVVFALHGTADPELILSAMRSGASEYLYPPLKEQLLAAFSRAAARVKDKQASRPGGKVVGFVSAKGGCGATTLACHVAVEIAAQSKRRTLLADLDLHTGLVGFLMKSKSVYSISDAAGNLQRLDPSYWSAIISNGIPGLELLTAPSKPSARDVTAQELRHVVSFARAQYDWLVLDLGRGVNRDLMTLLEVVDETYVVSTLDVPALHQAKNMVQVLIDIGYRRDALRLVLNRVPKRTEITEAEVEQMLAVPVQISIVDDYETLHEAYAGGKLASPGTNLGRQYVRLARKIAGIEETQKKRFSLFG
jgi:pilus assembly protein CpaE